MTAPELAIRRATAGDAAAIAKIHVRSWQSAYRGQIPDHVLDALDETARAAGWYERLASPAYVSHVALREGNVIGFCSLVRSRDPESSDDTGEVSALYVEPAHVRTGAGRALVRTTFAAARAAGYRALTLWVLASNEGARRFYERMGFAPDGASKVADRLANVALSEVRYRRLLAE